MEVKEELPEDIAESQLSPSIPRRISIHQLVEAERPKNIAPLLQKTPALINSHNKEGYTPLHTACLKGLVECVETLLEIGEAQTPKIQIDAKDSTGWTPLHCASLNGHTECVKILLAHGADVNSITSNGNTALHYAASWLIYLPF